MNKKALELSLSLIIKIVILLALVFIAGLVISNIREYARQSAEITQPPCTETGKTLAETDKILFDYFELGIGEESETERTCRSYRACFPAQGLKYKEECDLLAKT